MSASLSRCAADRPILSSSPQLIYGVQANRLVGNDGFGFEALAPANFPNVVNWHARLCERPAFAEHVMPRFA